jgi:hypothetical protein
MTRGILPLPAAICMALCLALCMAPPARADKPPAVQPLRDVDITYRVPVPGLTVTSMLQRLRFSAALHKQRLDLPTSGNWMLLDFTAHTMDMVREQSREIVEVPAPDSASQPGAGAGFVRLGRSSVVGIPCTEWRTRDTRGQETIACYTDDGVLLRAANSDGPLMEAVEVNYATVPADVFELPRGFQRQLPEEAPR